MYRQKSEIIGQIQSYHMQVAKLYHDIHERIENKEMKTLIYDLYEHEKSRERYLERHKKIAEAINCWLDFPCERLSNQITECFENLNTGSSISVEELIKIELHFDDCLIKLYNILSSENALSEAVSNIFYYMLKKTTKEKNMLAEMFNKSGNNLNYTLSQQTFHDKSDILSPLA
jgi:hypothetical protein